MLPKSYAHLILDYDGGNIQPNYILINSCKITDDVILIWEPSLVAEFHNADDRLSEKPASVENSFEREPITAGAVQSILAELSYEDRLRALTGYLLGSLKVPNLLGLCKHPRNIDESY